MAERPDDAGHVGGRPESPSLVTPDLLRSWPLPEPGGTKYARGQVLVVGGSCTTPGAVLLAGTAALRMGAGRLSVATAEGVAMPLAVALPVSGTLPLAQDEQGVITGERVVAVLEHEIVRADAVLVGPGLLGRDATRRLLGAVISMLPDEVPVVLDAAAVTALPDLDDASTAALRGRAVLTPNTHELASLLDQDEVSEDDVAESALGDLRAPRRRRRLRPLGGGLRPVEGVHGRHRTGHVRKRGRAVRGPGRADRPWRDSAAGHALGEARPRGGRRRPRGPVGPGRLSGRRDHARAPLVMRSLGGD